MSHSSIPPLLLGLHNNTKFTPYLQVHKEKYKQVTKEQQVCLDSQELPEDRRRWWRGHMPLKQEQASPERPRCMGGANEHWGFRNPVTRQMGKNIKTEGKDKKDSLFHSYGRNEGVKMHDILYTHQHHATIRPSQPLTFTAMWLTGPHPNLLTGGTTPARCSCQAVPRAWTEPAEYQLSLVCKRLKQAEVRSSVWAKCQISPRCLEGLDTAVLLSVSGVNEVIFNRELIIRHNEATEEASLPPTPWTRIHPMLT